ncbi:hypothetical protein [Nocardia brasiliensis]|uniref:Excreted virulence factor EspC, type VII ESX diderm n=1 Tax=Nocardia brasiliensis (strain ATCC 700358 / HUJEG-1) TaxID=1133849 RepID=K0EH81_NOCB7|nr:hypothetical protein [Nocardia brasiliensis]AFT98637.1 hypothetical protein O3I_003375 [Nocardia brasiliensis ATCC 700358]
MKVDPAELRALAASMDKISGEIGGLKALAADTLSTALPGSTISSALSGGAPQIEAAWLRMAQRCKAVSNIAKGGAGNYEVTDTDFRDKLNAAGSDR